LSQDNFEKERTIQSLKEQIVFLQKENTNLKLNKSNNADINNMSVTKSTQPTSKNSSCSSRPNWNNELDLDNN